jgi:ABC-type Fe3+ transport system permease subunit
MKITAAHFLVPILCILVGAVLIYLGLRAGWGVVWAAGGGFFVTLGISAEVLALAWVLPGPVGTFLRHPVISILMVVIVLAMMALTVYLGIASQWL